jgi:hypothetical protein
MTYLCSVLSVILMTLYNNFTEQLHKEITKKKYPLYPIISGLLLYRHGGRFENLEGLAVIESNLMEQVIASKFSKIWQGSSAS